MKKKILLVDDNAQFRNLIAEIIKDDDESLDNYHTHLPRHLNQQFKGLIFLVLQFFFALRHFCGIGYYGQ